MTGEESRQSASSILRVIQTELRYMLTATGDAEAKAGTTLVRTALKIDRKLAKRRETTYIRRACAYEEVWAVNGVIEE
jgi:hypothetical protein